jgi:TupA-like ATPgrasp
MGWQVPPRAGLAELLLAPLQHLATAGQGALAVLDAAAGYPVLRRRFRQKIGHWPDFHNPRSMNEKINWRKLHDRHPVYTVISDKVRVADYLALRLGTDRARRVMPDRVLVTDRPRAHALEACGTGVAIKASHGSHWVRIVPEGERPDWAQLAAEARMWLRQHEWAYRGIRPQVLVERLVTAADGAPADDVKIAVMEGRAVYIFLEVDRFRDHRLSYYHPDWTPLDLVMGANARGAHRPAPPGLDGMLALAEEIGRDFDYIRVDFLAGADEWRLNELTVYRSSGLAAFDPPELDLHYGLMWRHRPYAGVWPTSKGR